MDAPSLLPGTDALVSEHVLIEPEQVIIVVRSVQPRARCPDCGEASVRVHSRYERTLADLPTQGTPVRLQLRLRRFFCDNRRCSRRTFAERLPEVAKAHARQSVRLSHAHQWIALACGGECGARLARRLGMPISADTLLRHVRRLPEPASRPREVIGVDDWALRRGQRYGTILCDLERHEPIDLLPERSAHVLRDWLGVHPEVTVIARDRGDEYIKGADEGAPDAVQVADRWHLRHNLHEALMREADRHQRDVLEAAKAATIELESREQVSVEPVPPPAPPSPVPAPRQPTRAEQRKQASRARRLRRYEQVIELHRQGMSLRAIAQRMGMNRGTVRRFVRAGHFPERADRPTHSGVDPFVPYLRRRWYEGCTNAAALLQELRRKGFTGSYHMVRRCVARWREPNQRAHQVRGPKTRHRRARLQRPSSRRVAWALTKDHADLKPEERVLRKSLCAHCPTMKEASALARWFTRLMHTGRANRLDAWVAHASASGAPELKSFAHSLNEDLASIKAALTLLWSNGQVEGQINRLKLVKRQMYGRAKFDLLRARFLHAV